MPVSDYSDNGHISIYISYHHDKYVVGIFISKYVTCFTRHVKMIVYQTKNVLLCF